MPITRLGDEPREPCSFAAASTLNITRTIASSRRSRIGPDPTTSSSSASRRSWGVDSLAIGASWVHRRLPSIWISGFSHRVCAGHTVRVKTSDSRRPAAHGAAVRPASANRSGPDGRHQGKGPLSSSTVSVPMAYYRVCLALNKADPATGRLWGRPPSGWDDRPGPTVCLPATPSPDRPLSDASAPRPARARRWNARVLWCCLVPARLEV